MNLSSWIHTEMHCVKPQMHFCDRLSNRKAPDCVMVPFMNPGLTSHTGSTPFLQASCNFFFLSGCDKEFQELFPDKEYFRDAVLHKNEWIWSFQWSNCRSAKAQAAAAKSSGLLTLLSRNEPDSFFGNWFSFCMTAYRQCTMAGICVCACLHAGLCGS